MRCRGVLPAQTAADDEARKAALLSACPFVVMVFEAGILDDRAFLAMEFVEGVPVTDWLGALPRSGAATRDRRRRRG